jgi:hypothetical protein
MQRRSENSSKPGPILEKFTGELVTSHGTAKWELSLVIEDVEAALVSAAPVYTSNHAKCDWVSLHTAMN